MGTKEPVDKEAVNGSAPKHLTREQKRQIDRQTEKAMQQFQALCSRFSDFIYNTDDLTDEMVDARRNELNAKWSLYVKEHRLSDSSKTAFRDFCVELYKEYKTELKGGEAEDNSSGKVINE